MKTTPPLVAGALVPVAFSFRRLALFISAALAALPLSARALTLPVAEDTSTTTSMIVAKGAGKAATLPVSASRSALMRFEVSSFASTVTSAQVSGARLVIYVAGAAKPGDLSLHAVTSPWSEVFSAPVTVPTFGAALTTIQAASLAPKQFIIVDVTATVKGWLDAPASDFGFALTAASPTNVVLGAKEGSATGYPATLEIDVISPAGVGAITSTQLAPNLTLGGITMGTFSGDGSALTNLNISSMLSDGSVTNAKLANASLTINPSGGLTGGGAVALGGNVTLSLGSDLALTGTTLLPAGTATAAPLKFQAGVNLATPVFGALEFDGTNLFLTNNSATPARKTLAFTDSAITAAQIANGTLTGAMLAPNLTLAGTTTGAFSGNGAGLTGVSASSVSANLDLPVTSSASTGAITQGGVSLLHTFGTQNFLAGQAAGNFTMSGAYNTALGFATFQANTTGANNTASGYAALQFNTTGSENTAHGFLALYSNMTGINNTATGSSALRSNTSGSFNTADGRGALYSNTTGLANTAIGLQALYSNTIGTNNTANGVNALFSNTTAGQNVAVGRDALNLQSYDNGGVTWNSDNVAVGFEALRNNQPLATSNGINNTALGTQALKLNTTGFSNTATGWQALFSNNSGVQNVAIGAEALRSNTGGSGNLATGYQALYLNKTGARNTAGGFQALYSNDTGSENTAGGYRALYANTSGMQNTAFGREALRSNTVATGNTAAGYQALAANTDGAGNTATGFQALATNVSASANTASGYQALFKSTGGSNTATGYLALYNNLSGPSNTAFGSQALYSNTLGFGNTASGVQALVFNTVGNSNTASGMSALYGNTTGSHNVAIGDSALLSQTFSNNGVAWNSDNVAVGFYALYSNQPVDTMTGIANTAVGTLALCSNSLGNRNVAGGFRALFANTTGFENTACGHQALVANNVGGYNTALGSLSLSTNTSGMGNTAIGYSANVSTGNLTNATAIGYQATVDASNKVRIGNGGVTVIEGQVPYTYTSDRTKKENFLPVDGAEVLRKLRGVPVTSWNYIGTEEKPIRHYGPMAQDFHEAFGQDAVGTIGTPTTLNSGDAIGILMSAVQALGDENAALRAEAAGAQKRVAELEARLTRLERLVPERPESKAATTGLKKAVKPGRPSQRTVSR